MIVISQRTLCVCPDPSLYVHLIMSEANGQWLSVQDSRKPRGSYTGERLSVRKAQAIINALARGEPITLIAKRLRTSHETVRAMRDREYAEISRRKQLIAASAARLAANGFDRLNAEMDAGNIKGALLVPVTGMATDKLIALTADAPVTFQQYTHQHVHFDARRAFSELARLTRKIAGEDATDAIDAAEVATATDASPTAEESATDLNPPKKS